VALVTTNVSEERSASTTRVTGIIEIGTTLAVTSNRHMHIITEDGILHSHRFENLKSYMIYIYIKLWQTSIQKVKGSDMHCELI
jgi:hypothetical protein